MRASLLAASCVALLSANHCPWHRDPTPGCTSDPTSPECSVVAGSKVLGVPTIAQQSPVWCWAASAEMVFRYYGLPSVNPFGNYQCGIVAAYFQGPCLYDCTLCISSISTLSELERVVDGYGYVARQQGIPSPILTSQLAFRALSMRALANEIDAGRPVIAGISAGGFPYPNVSQHAVVIVGYDATGAEPAIFVNDPFPYDYVAGAQNPYYRVGAQQIQPGRFRISYQAMVGYMAWANTIYGISNSGAVTSDRSLSGAVMGGDHAIPVGAHP